MSTRMKEQKNNLIFDHYTSFYIAFLGKKFYLEMTVLGKKTFAGMPENFFDCR
jgi:hypothetical protein